MKPPPSARRRRLSSSSNRCATRRLDRRAKLLTSLRLTVVLLGFGLLLVFVGTLAQVHEGLYEAQTRYFKSWFIWRPTIGDNPWPLLLPGGYCIGTLLLVNLLAAHIQRFRLSARKIGIHLTHGGLILLLLGQLLTDMFSTESAMRLAEGEAKNYSQDFRANELVVIDTSDPRNDRVVSIPESLVARKGLVRHPALPVNLRVSDYWQNCDVDEVPPVQAIPVAANRGNFREMLLLPLPESSASGEPARAAALVEVLSDAGSLGTFLVPAREPGQTFRQQNRKWSLALVFAPAMGGNQLLVTEAADVRGEGMIAFPEADLVRKTDLRREGLPVTLRVKDFWSSCRLYRRPAPNSVRPQVTQGAFA